VDFSFFVGERFARAELFKDVVHPRDREPRMRRLLLFAMGIEGFAEVADFLLLGFGCSGKREFGKAVGVVVVGAILQKRTRFQRTRAVSSGTSSPVTGCFFIVTPSHRVTGLPDSSRTSSFLSYSRSASRHSMLP
jgi:hypothetical protein